MTDKELIELSNKLAKAIQANTMLRISRAIQEESLRVMEEAFGKEIQEKLK